ncbi:hypothetical protein M0R45_036129 [Rubus argutus]|uniref:N-acetyltransferase domain-containing protein n=1 Tax=Rubus argutus TaxID=59490 RepID=A0AAW1VXY0_RUBAR
MVSGDEEIEHGLVCDWACGGNEVGLQFGAVVDAMKTPREDAGTPTIRGGVVAVRENRRRGLGSLVVVCEAVMAVVIVRLGFYGGER